MRTRFAFTALVTLLAACTPKDSAPVDSASSTVENDKTPTHVARIEGRVFSRRVEPIESVHVRIDMEHLDSVPGIRAVGAIPAMLEGAEAWSDSAGRFTLSAQLFRAREVPESLLLAVHSTLAPVGDSAVRKMDTVWVHFARTRDAGRDTTAARLFVTLPTWETKRGTKK